MLEPSRFCASRFRVLRYYMWAVGEKALSLMPGGRALYRRVGQIVKAKCQGIGPQLASAFPVARKAKDLLRSGATVIDIGAYSASPHRAGVARTRKHVKKERIHVSHART